MDIKQKSEQSTSNGGMLSVLIPARNEKYLQRTIENVLENARGEIEIIAICDGYWPDPPIKDDPRVKLIHNTTAEGQRQSINAAARIAKGKYIMKLDAHCAVDEGFDVKLAADCEYNWTVIPRMYNLDIDSWTPKMFDNYEEAVKMGKVNDYMYIGWSDKGDIRAFYYNGTLRKKLHLENKDKLIDETMCCMGPGWFMHKDRFWELGGCDENHGSWGQQGIEVALKAWLSGGKLVVNKKTWFAHWFRGHIGWPYPMRQKDINHARDYSKALWMNNGWEGQTRSMEWLVDKFQPPTWDKSSWKFLTHEKRMELFTPMYKHIHRRKNDASWKGVSILKFPTDLTLYAEAIWEKRPEVIVEIGTKFGGSALYYQDLMESYGIDGKVITVDIKDQVKEKDPRIEYIFGNSIDIDIVNKIKDMVKGKRTMLVIDGNHDRVHVKWELKHYNEIVSPGQYMVVEDCYIDRGLYGPGEAKEWFLSFNKDFVQTDICKKYIIGITMDAWLLRK